MYFKSIKRHIRSDLSFSFCSSEKEMYFSHTLRESVNDRFYGTNKDSYYLLNDKFSGTGMDTKAVSIIKHPSTSKDVGIFLYWSDCYKTGGQKTYE